MNRNWVSPIEAAPDLCWDKQQDGTHGNKQPHAPKSKVLSLEETPSFLIDCEPSEMSYHIALYLIRRMHEYQAPPGCCFILPSLSSLSQLFHAPCQEIQKALKILKTKDYDYMAPGYYGNISVWPRISAPALESAQSQYHNSSPLKTTRKSWTVAFINSKPHYNN